MGGQELNGKRPRHDATGSMALQKLASPGGIARVEEFAVMAKDQDWMHGNVPYEKLVGSCLPDLDSSNVG
jgi:hypothetical protein